MTKEDKIRISINTAIVAGIVVVLMSVLLLLNYWLLQKTDPLENDALKTLVERSLNNPEDVALREDVRNLDLMARKAYFSAKWQTRTGSYILLIAGIVFVVSLRYYYIQVKRVQPPAQEKAQEGINAFVHQKWILALGMLLMILGILAGLISKSPFEEYQATQSLKLKPEQESTIEVIEIANSDSTATESDSSIAAFADGKELSDSIASTKIENKLPAYPTVAEVKANYSNFRGFWGNGVVDFKNIPTQWNIKTGDHLLWKTEIPVHGYNSPVLWGDKLFVAGAVKEERVVYCLNRNTGAMLWQKKVEKVPGSPTKSPKTTDDTGLSAPSISTDGRKVFALFGNGDLIALSMKGKELWSRNIGVPDNHYGHSSSLIVDKDQLFIQFDSNRGGKVFSIQTETGKTKWETIRKCKISWASPIIAEIKGQKQLILASNPIVAGYDLQSGKELWSVNCMYGEVGPSPAYGSGLIFAANEYAKLVAIDPANGYSIKWEADEFLPEVSSPVVSNNLLFIATSYGALVCYDAITGDKYWEKEYNDGFYSTPIVVEGKLYAIDMGGIVHIVKVDKQFTEIASPNMYEEIVTTPAFSDGRIYIRGKKYLYAIGN
jgi:outer membrane protein assembly factor BamB